MHSVSDSSTRRAKLSAAKRALLDKYLRGEVKNSSNVQMIPRRLDGYLVLSFSQQRLWFLDQLEGPSAAYNISGGLRFSGPLDVVALERSLREIVRRHEVLRTTFPTVEGVAVQRIAPVLEAGLPVVELQGLGEGEREGEVRRLAAEEARRPFDLARGPLLRVCLLKLGEEDHGLLVTLHHIVTDGWSMGVFIHELSALYQAFCTGAPSPLAALPIQYADFAAWQREWLQGAVLEEQLGYWQQQLAGAPGLLELPTDRPRPAVQGFRGASVAFGLEAELTHGLKALSQEAGVTLFMTLLGAFMVLLARYSRQEDIVVGSPIANRTHSQTEGLIGFFVNTLVLRADLAGDPPFEELLRRVRRVALEAYAHQEVPFERVVEALQPERNLSHSPLFQVLFALQNVPVGELELPGLSLSPLTLESVTAKFGLSLLLSEAEGGLVGVWEYSTELFEAATIERLGVHLQTLLEGIVADPKRRLSELPLLPEAEWQQVVVEWNATEAEYPKERCIHQLFEVQVKRTSEAVAVVFEDEWLTYRALNARANQLAHHLQALGIGPEGRVGVCLERSLELVVGLLGILKAGGAYVPLDPTYPPERLAFMLEDAQVGVLLTQAHLEATLPQTGVQVRCLDRDWERIAQGSEANPASGVQPDNLAYVIYTSGSTGIPKGVAIEHHSPVALLEWSRKVFTPEERVGVLASTSICFDLSVFELFVPLSWGGKVILAENALQLPALPMGQEVTLVNTVPSAMAELVRSEGVPISVRAVNLAGEPLQNTLVQQIYRQESIQRVFNLYGPSEDTTYSTFALMSKGREEAPSIGRPITNTQVYLLDRQLHPVPLGVPGELYLGGAGLARGYLQRPELTPERFIPHPFSEGPGARLYKTGDLARYRPDGNIEFLGRIDHQVKIRGFRIELGEIEAVLGGHPGVQEAVVLAREDHPGEKRLVAYVVAQEGPAPSGNELRGFLKERLPEYMVPSAFMALEALPLTPNGKVDRKALPAPEGRGVAEGYVPPCTPTEELLAGIWAEVLRQERVGRQDNFFTLGGHSLVAIQVVSRVRDTFGVELPVRCVFESPTVAELSAAVEAARGEQRPALPPIEPLSREGALALSFAQQRLWFLDQLEGPSAAYNMPGGLRLSGPLHVVALEQSLREIVRRHEGLRTSFPTVEGVAVQRIAPVLEVGLPVVELQGLGAGEREAEVRRLAAAEAQRPFDLARGPLLRVCLLKLEEEEHGLLVTLHHIVTDEWSTGVFIHELSALYQTFSTGRPSPLAGLPIQYADFAAWQREWLQGAVLEEQLRYWQQQLAGAPGLLELPTDRPRPAVQSFRGAIAAFGLEAELTHGLKALSQRAGMTLFMTLLGAFMVLLARYSRQEDIVVGSPTANRTQSQTEGLIGFFVNTVVLRADLAGDPPFEELMRRVRRVALEAYAHQEVPFERVVEALQPERSLSHSPLFQVMFDLENVSVGELVLPGLSLSPMITLESVTAKFDLSLTLSEAEGGLVGVWEYSTDLFEAATIKRLGAHLQILLEGIVADPKRRLSELPLLPEAERQQVLVEWNATEAAYPTQRCLHELFEAQVKKTPEAVAVVFEDQWLTYRALNAQANQLAHHLRSLGAGPEWRVGICLERSLEMVVGPLGVLKAGGAYVPLDAAYPQERLTHILNDARVAMLLTQETLKSGLPQQEVDVITLDSLDPDWKRIAQESDENPVSKVSPEHLAYVIYTSGSTGNPKGVMITHRSLVNAYFAYENAYQLRNVSKSHLQMASFSFDVCSGDLVRALCSGAKLVLCPQEWLLAPEQLYQLMQAEAVDYAEFVPAVLNNLTQYLERTGQNLDFMRVLVAGSDSWYCKQFDELKGFCSSPGTRCINSYGVTEATIDSSCFENTEVALSIVDGIVPIGRPFANTQLYILDSALQPAPIGVPGELHIGGAGLARGYLNCPDLTAEKFIPNPFSQDPGSRLYKTGDLVRYLSDGNLEILGRIDHQVKVRGFRIELGEIEAVLGGYPGLQEACVVVREDHPGEKRLVAYVVVVAQEGPAPSGNELRRFLRERLPEYMVPSAFMTLEALPLTPNGKVDRKALPAPEGRGVAEGYVAPCTPTEELLAGIWGEVLRQEWVGRHDNFFALGGDSILSIQIVARGHQAGLQLTPRQLFQHQSIAELAAVVSTGPTIEADQGLVSGAASLTPIQRWFFEQGLPAPQHYNQAMLLEVPPTLEPGWVRRVVRQLLVQHDALRLRFIPEGMGLRQVQAGQEEAVPFGVVDLSELGVEEQPAALEGVAAEQQGSLNLSSGPLLRVVLFKLGAQRPGRLLIVIHHLVVDGVSWRILLEDFQRAYQQLRCGQALQLPPKTTAFKAWAERLMEYGGSEVVREELNYWLGRSRREVRPLPRDYASDPEANTVASAAHVVVALSAEQTGALLQEVPPVYHTQINDVLLTALVQSLRRWTGERALLLDLEGHGREELLEGVDLSRTVGWFTTVFPVGLELGAEPPGEALKAVKEQLRSIPKGGIGYGLLRYVHPDTGVRAGLQALPQAEISFNYLGQMDQTLSESSLFEPAKESSGPPHNSLQSRSYLLEVDGFVVAGRLHLDWTYSRQVHRWATVKRLAGGFLEALGALIAHCQSPEAGGFTPSDFPGATLSQENLNKFITRIKQARRG